jgi:hypothetical protein
MDRMFRGEIYHFFILAKLKPWDGDPKLRMDGIFGMVFPLSKII